MPKQLSDIELGEVTVCEEPANDDCVAVIVKAKPQPRDAQLMETDMPNPNEIEDDELEAGADEGDFVEVDDETADAIAADIEALNEEGALVPAFATLLAERQEFAEAVTKMAELIEDGEERFEALAKSTSQLIAKIEKSGGAIKEDDDLVSVMKAALGGAELDPVVERRVAALEAVAKAADDREAIEKAKAIGLGKPEDLAKHLSAIRRKFGAETGDYVEGLMKSAAATIKKSKTFERAGVDDAPPSTAFAKAKVAATEIRKAKPDLTEQQALTRVWTENPELYEEYRAEQRAA